MTEEVVMPVLQMVTIEGVELASTGYWYFSTGPRWLEQSHLEDAVKAQNDPALKTPIIKIGHSDPRFDGDPLFGTIVNLRLSENKQTLLGDWVIASSLAPLVAKSPDQEGDVPYPDRSIEGWFDHVTATGNEYSFILTACSLLGAEAPAIESLDDLIGIFTDEGAFVAAASKANDVKAGTKLLLAGTTVDKIRLGVWDELPADDQPWGDWSWVRRLEIDNAAAGFLIVEDDDTARLYRVPWTVKGDDVTYGAAEEVVEQFVAAAKGDAKNLSFRRDNRENHGDAATVTATTATEGTPAQAPKIGETQVELADLRKKLGLPDDADEDAVNAKLDEVTKAAAVPDPEKPDESTPPADPPADPVEPEDKSLAAAKKNLPEGFTVIDTETLEGLRASGAKADGIFEGQRVKDRDALFVSAVKEGRIAPKSVKALKAQYDKDPEGIKAFVAEQPTNTIPLKARGHEEDLGDGITASSTYPSDWLTESERSRVTAAVKED